MAVEIIWSSEVKDDFTNLLSYLQTNWSDDIAERFKETVYKKIDLLATMPEMGIESGLYPTVRRIRISRYGVLYYQFSPGSSIVFLLRIFDTRANPADNPYD